MNIYFHHIKRSFEHTCNQTGVSRVYVLDQYNFGAVVSIYSSWMGAK